MLSRISRTQAGIIVAALFSVINALGIELPFTEADAQEVIEHAFIFGGLLLAFIGRILAREPVGVMLKKD